jgi:hypothetical protein
LLRLRQPRYFGQSVETDIEVLQLGLPTFIAGAVTAAMVL